MAGLLGALMALPGGCGDDGDGGGSSAGGADAGDASSDGDATSGGSSGSAGAGGSSGSAGSAGASGSSGSAGSAGASGSSGSAGSAGDDGGSADAAADAMDATSDSACELQPELCNGIDDNCNGEVDEGDPGGGGACTVSGTTGPCADGVLACANGALTCEQTVFPLAEDCNGIDDNCDGAIDEGNPGGDQDCNTGNPGVCAAGKTECASGAIVCTQVSQPEAEVCNGLDDDCNGEVDDGFPGAGQPCTVSGQPAGTPCAEGQTTCEMGGQIGCAQTFFPSAESCDGVDNDCNGTTDDSSELDDKPCATGLPGVCASGKTLCSGSPAALSCVPNVAPGSVAETCNALDDDCDGAADDVADIDLECSTKHAGAQNVSQWQCAAGGLCEVSSCSGSFSNCNGEPGDGCEVDTATDPQNCAACGTTCDATNGVATCTSGQCGINCDNGFGNCDGDLSNGCEHSLAADLANCGACGNACSGANGTPSCSGGACSISCAPGFGNCDGNAGGNGCETDTASDLSHCGGCGQACDATNGTPSCTGGACSISCNPGFGDCDGNAGTGCESPLDTLANCGGCGQICSLQNASVSCAGGSCTLTGCNGSFANCDGNDGNGCEVDTQGDVAHCGGCGQSCDATNGTPSCTLGSCSIACDSGFANCDGSASNGCEVNTQTSAAHCGACNADCSAHANVASATCSSGQCGYTCDSGFGDCTSADGCETALSNNDSHCGACGNACSGGKSCAGTSCVCPSGQSDCSGTCQSLADDAQNCGACGNDCATHANVASATCSGGACGYVCDSGFDDCTSAPGCETSLVNNDSHCGACGNACGGGKICSGTSCVCPAGQTDCNGTCVTLSTSSDNCGSCGNDCSAHANVASASCSGGTCAYGCDSGFDDCTSAPGCETSIVNNDANCGACGNACGGGKLCSGTSCACPSGQTDCSGTCQDLSNDPQNCGGCGLTCPSGALCSGGQCSYGSQTCPAGQFAIGFSAAGVIQCATLNSLAMNAVHDRCRIYSGWRDSCVGCASAPAKWGFVGQTACFPSGADNTCAPQTLGGSSVNLFGLNTDGDVDDNDQFYHGFRCADGNSGSATVTGTCPPGMFITSLNPDGSFVCSWMESALVDYLRSDCRLYAGYQDNCDGCTSLPTKYGWASHGSCQNLAGGTCATHTLGGESVPMFRFDTDGNVDGNDKFSIGFSCAALTGAPSVVASCPAAQFAQGVSGSNVSCLAAAAQADDYVRTSCHVYSGWRDSCDGCTTAPVKWGRASSTTCQIGAGAQNTCATFNLGGVSVPLFGLNTDGDVNGDDKFHVGLRCF